MMKDEAPGGRRDPREIQFWGEIAGKEMNPDKVRAAQIANVEYMRYVMDVCQYLSRWVVANNGDDQRQKQSSVVRNQKE